MIYFAIICIVISTFFMIKNERTYTVYERISYAIYMYRLDCIRKGENYLVDFADERSYESVLFHFWDWGYKHVLPKEKFEIIKPYLFMKGEET